MQICETVSKTQGNEGPGKGRKEFEKVGALRGVKEDSIVEEKESKLSLI